MPAPRAIQSVLSRAAILALLCAPAARAYAPSDLAGTWWFHALASGPGAPWWEYAHVSVAPDGAFSGTTQDSQGGSSAVSATFTLSASGLLGLPPSSTFHGAMDQGTTVIAATDTWDGVPPTSTELRVGLRTLGAYVPADLVGAWEVAVIASGPGAPWWQRGRVSVAANGGLSGTLIDNLGAADPVSGTLVLAPDGVLTMAGSPSAHGAMDAGHTVMAMTSTWTGFDAGTTDLTLALKMGGGYTLADLAGRWETHSLAAGPGAPWWSHGTLDVAANGSYTGSVTEFGGASHPVSGTFAITTSGVVTRSGSATARGALDAERTVMVFTETWSGGSPGTAEMLIAVRTSGATTDAPRVLARGLELRPVSPNPVRGAAPPLRFTLPSAAPAALEVVDANGRRVASREVGSLGAGEHHVVLAGTQHLPPGVYWARLQQGGVARVRRWVVLE